MFFIVSGETLQKQHPNVPHYQMRVSPMQRNKLGMILIQQAVIDEAPRWFFGEADQRIKK